MGNLKEKLVEDQNNSLRKGDKVRLSTLRMLISAITNKEIALQKKGVGLSDEEIGEIIASEVKKRRDAAAEFKKGNREESAKKEEEESEILKSYLPPEISDSELSRILSDGIREVDAKDEKDFGKVMKAVMQHLKGKASGDRISKMLKQKLSKGQ